MVVTPIAEIFPLIFPTLARDVNVWLGSGRDGRHSQPDRMRTLSGMTPEDAVCVLMRSSYKQTLFPNVQVSFGVP